MRYTYPTTDFTTSNGLVALDSMFRVIDTTLSGTIIDLGMLGPDTFFVDFVADLSVADVNALDGIVASHTGVGLPSRAWTAAELNASNSGEIGLRLQAGPNEAGSARDGIRLYNDGGTFVPAFYQSPGTWVRSDGTSI